MYSLDGVPLNTGEWVLRAPTRPLSELVVERDSVRARGRHGVIPGTAWSISPLILTFVVQTPRESYEALLALFTHGSLLSQTESPDRVAAYELLSSTYVGYGPSDRTIDASFVVRIPEVFWRDVSESTTAMVALSGASVMVDAWEGSSGVVRDAIVRLRGPFEGLQVLSGRSWFAAPAAVDAGSYLRFHSDTGRAFVTVSDVWEGGTEVSGSVDFDGPDGYFAIVPHFTDPAVRHARVEVTTTSRGAGAAAQLRGKGAYLA